MLSTPFGRRRRWAIGSAVGGTTLALALAGCTSPETPSATAAEAVSGGSLTWALEVEPETVNPQLNGQSRTQAVFLNVYESLLTRDADGGYVPLLATSYEISDDGTDYTFTLRDDVTFSNGEAFDADAVTANFEQLNNPEYDEEAAGQGPLSRLESVEAVDPQTVTFHLSDPYGPFLAYVSAQYLIAPSAYSSADITAGGTAVAGTGPFVIDDYQEGQEIRLTRRDDYDWAPTTAAHSGAAYLDDVTYRFLPEGSVRIGALTSRQVDVIDSITGADVEVIEGDPELEYESASTSGAPWSLYLNTVAGPTQDITVREAFIAATDVDALVESVYFGERSRAWANVNSAEVALYDPALENTYGNDPERANELLDEAGWTERDSDGYRIDDDGTRLSITVYTTQEFTADGHDVVLQGLQAQVRESAGIDLDVQSVDIGTWYDHYVANDYGALENSIGGDGAVTLEWHWLAKDAGGAVNLSNYSDAQTVEWLDDAASSTDPAAQSTAYRALQEYVILDRSLVLPLVEGQNQIASHTGAHGVGFRPYFGDPQNVYDVWLDPR